MLKEHLDQTIALVQANPAIGIAAAIVIAALFYFRPKDMFKLTAFCVFVAAAFYVMTLLIEATGSGSKQKDQMIYKTKEAIGE